MSEFNAEVWLERMMQTASFRSRLEELMNDETEETIPGTEKAVVIFTAPRVLLDEGISPEQIQTLVEVWGYTEKYSKRHPEMIKGRSRVERYVYRWETRRKWLELKLIVGDSKILEIHLGGMSGDRLTFRNYINDVGEADVRSAFEWLYDEKEENPK